MDESKVEKKRGKKVGIPENLMDEVIEKSLQTPDDTLGHDQNGVAMVEIPPESEPTRPADPEATGLELAAAAAAAAADTPIKKRGRPKGVKNKPKPSKKQKSEKKTSPDPFVRFTSSISTSLLNRVKNAVYYTPEASISKMLGDGLEKEVHLLEQRIKLLQPRKKKGAPFPHRPSSRLSAGRKIK